MMIKRICKYAGLFVYALVFGEIFLRVMAPQPLIPRYVTGAPDGIRANIPGVTYRQQTPEVDVELRINSQGIRWDREISLNKPEDVYRIVLLGDSFFMGYEVNLENSLAWQLEQGLRQHGVNAEVINLAVSGFGTAENLIALRERGQQYQPDLVIMEWHATDPADNLRSNLFRLVGNKLQPASKAYLPGIATRDALMKIPGYPWLIGNSHLYSAVREKAATAVKNLLLELNRSSNATEAVASTLQEKTGDLDVALINAVQHEAEMNGAKCVLLDVPVRQSRTAYKSAFSELDTSRLKGVLMVSPLEAFLQQAAPNKKLYFEKGHGHWTVEGNAIVAEVLADTLLERTLRTAGQRTRIPSQKLLL